MIRIIATLVVLIISSDSVSVLANTDGSSFNAAIRAMCDMIAFLQGRFGRAISMISIMIFAWKVSGGKIQWQDIFVLLLGIGMMFAPKTIALFILPSTIKGISGGIFSEFEIYTPDFIITYACPNIN